MHCILFIVKMFSIFIMTKLQEFFPERYRNHFLPREPSRKGFWRRLFSCLFCCQCDTNSDVVYYYPNITESTFLRYSRHSKLPVLSVQIIRHNKSTVFMKPLFQFQWKRKQFIIYGKDRRFSSVSFTHLNRKQMHDNARCG